MAFALRSIATLALTILTCASGLHSVLHAQDKDQNDLGIRVGTSAAEEKILAVLDDEAVLQFLDSPLGDVASLLSEQYDISIIIDNRALAEVGLDSSTPFSIDLTGVDLRAALDLALGDLGLSYLVDNSVLTITTIDKVAERPEIRIYDVEKLFPNSAPEPQQLATLISRAVKGDGMMARNMPGAGMGGGGFGGMGGMPPAGMGGVGDESPQVFVEGSLLVVRATLQDQHKVAEFLKALVQMKERTAKPRQQEQAEETAEEA